MQGACMGDTAYFLCSFLPVKTFHINEINLSRLSNACVHTHPSVAPQKNSSERLSDVQTLDSDSDGLTDMTDLFHNKTAEIRVSRPTIHQLYMGRGIHSGLFTMILNHFLLS